MAFVLIVETQVDLRGQLVRALEQAGHRAAAVATVSQAAQILAAEPLDLLATNVTLTDGSSAALVRQAEALGAKTLMMTGSPDRILEFDGAGQPYLSKPFPLETFLQRVNELVGPSS
jgi:DNA-binding response OmpR family regulator